MRAYKKAILAFQKLVLILRTMAERINLLDRIDTIRANSVSDKEFEQTWGKSLDSEVNKMMDRWDVLLAQAKATIDANK